MRRWVKVATAVGVLEDRNALARRAWGGRAGPDIAAIQRGYKPLLDGLGLTHPQYLVLNVLWGEDRQTWVGWATSWGWNPAPSRPCSSGLRVRLVQRARNPEDERQVIATLTDEGRGIRPKAGCLGASPLEASGQTPRALGHLNRDVRRLRDSVYDSIAAGSWTTDLASSQSPPGELFVKRSGWCPRR